MTAHGSSLQWSQAPHVLQCRANTSRHSRRMSFVGGDPHISTTTGGDFAIARSGPINFLRQYSAPLRSRVVHAYIRNNAIPVSNRGNDMKLPSQRSRFDNLSFIIALQILASVWLSWVGGFLFSVVRNPLNHNPRAEASHPAVVQSGQFETLGRA